MNQTIESRNNVEEVMALFKKTKKMHIKCNTPGCEGELNCMPNNTYKRKFGSFENMILTWKCRKCVAAAKASQDKISAVAKQDSEDDQDNVESNLIDEIDEGSYFDEFGRVMF